MKFIILWTKTEQSREKEYLVVTFKSSKKGSSESVDMLRRKPDPAPESEIRRMLRQSPGLASVTETLWQSLLHSLPSHLCIEPQEFTHYCRQSRTVHIFIISPRDFCLTELASVSVCWKWHMCTSVVTSTLHCPQSVLRAHYGCRWREGGIPEHCCLDTCKCSKYAGNYCEFWGHFHFPWISMYWGPNVSAFFKDCNELGLIQNV